MNNIYIVNKYYSLEIELNFIDHNFIIDNIDYYFKLTNNVLQIYWLNNEYEEYYTENSYIYYSDISLKNKIKLIYLIHDEWYDQAIIYDNIIKRIKYKDEKGIFSLHLLLENRENIEDNIMNSSELNVNKELLSDVIMKENKIIYKLNIVWDKWNEEIFTSKDNYTYYTDKIDINKNIILSEKIFEIKKKVYIFIHICCIENWKDIFSDQIKLIKESGLYNIITKINLCILGNINIINDIIFHDDKFNIIYIDTRIYLYEILTINSIKSFCERMDEEIYILYIHTKGVRRMGNDEIIKSWRNMMEYFLITNYIHCITSLEYLNYDTLGNNIINERCVEEKYANINPNHNLHYSGNFWWSKKSYIDKLDYIPLNLSKTCDYTRFKAENWILSSYPNMNIGIIFQDNTNIHPYYRYVFDYYKKMIFYIIKY